MSTQSEYHPALFQVNTRVTLSNLSKKLGRKATLDDFPDDELRRLASEGFDWIWFCHAIALPPSGF